MLFGKLKIMNENIEVSVKGKHNYDLKYCKAIGSIL